MDVALVLASCLKIPKVSTITMQGTGVGGPGSPAVPPPPPPAWCCRSGGHDDDDTRHDDMT